MEVGVVMIKELLFSLTKKDFKVTWYSGKGAGGQHRNKHQNCCRISHEPSKAVGRGTESRSRQQNQKMAVKRLVESDAFQNYVKRRVSGQILIEDKVNEMMNEENLLIEYEV